ncbi:MAG: hypothetical protein ABIT71_07690 [Vicinamibacteraceae bacterium]
MNTPVSTLTAAAAVSFLLTGAPLDGHDGAGSAAGHPGRPQAASSTTMSTVVVVLDDTKLLGPDEARHAAAGVDAVHRALVVGRVRVGAMTSGPGGLAVDATDAPNVLPPIAEALRSGAYVFRGTADPEKATQALDASVEDVLASLARVEGSRQVLVVIGRSATVSAERRARLEANATLAGRINLKVVWLDLERGGCDTAPPRDSTTLSEPAACGLLADQPTLARALDGARRFLAP